ncbi:MAG: TetR family transcriptional regulator [Candidatus Tectimicrobiota bacterium]|nr:MAG: TetR family transcriptional regulator [Candidatus Tectomicrobia bacterium]
MGRVSDARSRLVQTATELFSVRGATAVSVQDICARAGVKKGSFYHFFPSKRDLVLAVIEAYAARVQAMWEAALAGGGSVGERLARAFELAADALQAARETYGHLHGCPLGNLALELSPQDDVIRQKLQETFDGWTRVVERMLREAAGEGPLAAADVSMTARTIVAYFEGVMLLAKTQNDPAVVRQLAPGALRLMQGAVWPYPPAA